MGKEKIKKSRKRGNSGGQKEKGKDSTNAFHFLAFQRTKIKTNLVQEIKGSCIKKKPSSMGRDFLNKQGEIRGGWVT